MSLKDYLPGDKKNNKTIKVNHPKDHPDVQNIADKKYDKMKKKIFGGVGMLGDNIKKSRKMDAKATKEAKKFMDTVQTMKSKKMSEKMGSFAGGGSIRGYGAARTSGMGLQDEQLSPGKVYKAKRGSGLDLPVINSVKPAVHKTKRAQNLANYKIQFNKQRSRAGANPNSHFDKKNANVVKHTRVSGSPAASKFMERRLNLGGVDAKKYMKTIGVLPKVKHPFEKKGADKFTKLKTLGRVVGSSRVGKIALGVGTAGVAAQQYLKSKMNKKKDVKKKMGGGMMKKYSKGGGLDMGGPKAKIMQYIRDKKDDGQRLTMRDKDFIKSVMPKKKMGGGMMQKPMGYKHGTSVTASCKLGRNKPTKIT